ncbi:MAG: hypothetical protein Q4D74_03165 [Comamonadaceae bacterium]|nr:hypothetical protein [Comamonadaceae bacterium]
MKKTFSLRRALLLLWMGCGLALPAVASLPAKAESALPSAFRTPDGSYTIMAGGDVTDPYFVNKALIIALESGLDMRAELNAWLAWLLPRQRADGGFDRYCGARKGAWRACMPADADDSMAATTIHLVALAQRKKLLAAKHVKPAQTASRQARKLLDTLRDPASGLYRVFADRPVYYLMDNAEVYEALAAVGDKPAAEALVKAIRSGFYKGGRWLPALPGYEKESFYPHVLAHSYLWQGAIADKASAASDMAGWLAHHSRAWLSRSDDRFAWGLVAWNIAKLAPAEAACWRHSVNPLPKDVGWTVLDAFIDQALERRGIKPACARATP